MLRRHFLQSAALALATASPAARAWSQPRPFRVLLNSNFSGPQAFFFLAQDRGYLKAAGLDATFVGGDGAAATGIDATKVTVRRSPASMRALVEDMLAGRSAGVFGFVNTIIAAVAPAGIDGRTRLRFLEYRHHTPDLYGNTLMVSRRLLAERPADVAAFVRAVNRGLADTVTDLDAAIASVVARDTAVRADVDKPRLAGTLAMEMAHPEGRRLGIGDVDDGRLARGIALIAKSRGLPRLPAPSEIFTRACLPPLAERVTSLAR